MQQPSHAETFRMIRDTYDATRPGKTIHENGGKNCSTQTALGFQLADQMLWTRAPQSGGTAVGTQPGGQGDCKTNQ